MNTMNTIEITTERYEELVHIEANLKLILAVYDDETPWKIGDIINAFKSEQKCNCKCTELQSAAAIDE